MCLILKKKVTSSCINYSLYQHVSTCTGTTVTMAKIQFLTILLVVTCFLGGVVSVTDNDFEVRTECFWKVMFFRLFTKYNPRN